MFQVHSKQRNKQTSSTRMRWTTDSNTPSNNNWNLTTSSTTTIPSMLFDVCLKNPLNTTMAASFLSLRFWYDFVPDRAAATSWTRSEIHSFTDHLTTRNGGQKGGNSFSQNICTKWNERDAPQTLPCRLEGLLESLHRRRGWGQSCNFYRWVIGVSRKAIWWRRFVS